MLLSVGGGATGCARHSSLQKKTASYKRKAKSGKIPCPCESH
ncbi:hypothetical protein [Hymenobacter sp. J193]|nr:hypothetical protein [Hymenobacter sp. J193]